MLDQLRYEDFEPLLGKMIDVEVDGSRTQLEVATVQRLPSPSPRSSSFHLILRSRDGWQAGQGLFRLHHPTLGALDLFTVPLGPDGNDLTYQIIFN